MAKQIISTKTMTSDEYVLAESGGNPFSGDALERWLIGNGLIDGDEIVLEEGQTGEEYWQEVDRKRKAIDAERRKART